jgi:hypothetical protein
MLVQANQHLTVDAETDYNDDNRTIASCILSPSVTQPETRKYIWRPSFDGRPSDGHTERRSRSTPLQHLHYTAACTINFRRIGFILISLSLSEEFRLREWQNRRRALGKGGRKQGTGNWRSEFGQEIMGATL